VKPGRVLIRRARPCDLRQLVGLQVLANEAERAFSPDLSARRTDRLRSRRIFRRALGNPAARVFVAVVGVPDRASALVGMIGADLHRARHRHVAVRRHVYLHSLYVVAPWRGRRVARRLVRRALRWSNDVQAAQARLEMATPNFAARRLYAGFGFRPRESLFTLDLAGSASRSRGRFA
jgi:ribosomal protein S18 acetylase RimI-like enzyme